MFNPEEDRPYPPGLTHGQAVDLQHRATERMLQGCHFTGRKNDITAKNTIDVPFEQESEKSVSEQIRDYFSKMRAWWLDGWPEYTILLIGFSIVGLMLFILYT